VSLNVSIERKPETEETNLVLGPFPKSDLFLVTVVSLFSNANPAANCKRRPFPVLLEA